MPIKNGEFFNDRFYVQYSELLGLDGSYVPFNDRNMGVLINIHPQAGGRIVVSTDFNTVTLSEGDQLRIDSSKELIHVPGPNGYSNPYKAAVAESRLGQNLIKLNYFTEAWESVYPIWAFGYRYKDGKHQTYNFMDNGMRDTIDKTWDFYVILDDEDRVQEIRVRPKAHDEGAEYLRKFLLEKGFERKLSGMFDHYHDLNRQQKDAEYRQWWEGIMEENQAKEEREFNTAMEVIASAGTAKIELDGKVFLTKDGAVYRNAISLKNLVPDDTLRKDGLFLKIAQAAISPQPRM